MQRNFINIRLDRLKYSDLSALYLEIQDTINDFNAEDLYLVNPFARYSEKSALLVNLDTKDRTKYSRKEYSGHLKRLDELVSALLLHLKALKRADFPEFRYVVNELNKFFRKECIDFVHVGAENKKNELDVVFRYFDSANERLIEGAAKLGLLRYVEEMREMHAKLISIENADKAMKKGQANSAKAVKAKAELISEMRLLLQCIDVSALSNPDKDYTTLIANINQELKTHRAQLRNLQTRRIRKKEKDPSN